jgi:ABC-type Na+ efflux pump permease subunit
MLFLAIVKKELRAVAKEKTIMIAIGIQLFIASFSSVILVGLLSFYDPSTIALNSNARFKAGIMGHYDTVLIAYLRKHNIHAVYFDNIQDAETSFGSNMVDTLLYIPDESSDVVDLRLFLPEAETRSTVIMMALREPLEQYENHLRRQQGIRLNYQDLTGKHPTTFEFLYVTLIPILMFFPGFVAGSMVVDSISSEIEHQTLDTLLSAPISLNHIFGGKILAAFFLAILQAALWLILLRFNGVVIQNTSLVVLLSAIVAGLNGIGAALVTTALKDRERAQFVYSLLIILAAGSSYLLGSSPITLMSQLASGDYYAGFAATAVHGSILLSLILIYFGTTKRLMTMKL